ncbi:MAG: hypothetical protein IIY58_03130, partial [Aeriscardovia sp.]|nr:hypothetical protein [Aeriscardovia sp.]
DSCDLKFQPAVRLILNLRSDGSSRASFKASTSFLVFWYCPLSQNFRLTFYSAMTYSLHHFL